MLIKRVTRICLNKKFAPFLIAVSFLLMTDSLGFSQTKPGYILLKAGVHFDSQVSGGKYSLAELANIIARHKLDVGIITDHDNMKVSYGIRPFENFLKFTIEENSVRRYGVEKYINEINALDAAYPNLILIPGIEAVPYYRWEGSPLNENMVLRDWHTHLLVFGFENPKAFEQLPSLANHNIGYSKPDGKIIKYIGANFTHFALMSLYFLLFLISLALIFRRKYGLFSHKNINRSRHNIHFSFPAFIMAVIFGLILYNQYPFLPRKYTPYDHKAGSAPYQELIDYVNAHNGLVFWAHPEVTHNEVRPVNIPLMNQAIKISTEAYPHRIMETQDYTGFAIFWEGAKVIGRPGGLWDIALAEYCAGLRRKPVWAIGELDFEDSSNLNNVAETLTFLFVKERSRAGVYEAMRAGRMYATRSFTGDKIVIDDFSVYDLHTGNNAFIGETLTHAQAPVAIHIRLRALTTLNKPETIFLYRNSELIKIFHLNTVLDEWFVDESPMSSPMCYYRIYGGDSWPTLASNPIFVSK